MAKRSSASGGGVRLLGRVLQKTMLKDSYAIKVTGGQVRLYKTNGTFVRPIISGAKSAVIQGDEVHVTMPDGKVRIHALSGTYKRTL